MSSEDDEARRKLEKPRCTAGEIVAFVRARFTLAGGDVDPASVTELNSYDDRNYYARTVGGHEYTLKVHNGVESEQPALLAAQSAMMRHLHARRIPVPIPVAPDDASPSSDEDERDWAFVDLPAGSDDADEIQNADDDETAGHHSMRRRHAVRVLTWVPGEIAEKSERVVHTPAFMRAVGEFVGDVTVALDAFAHPGAHRWHQWDLANVLTVRRFAPAVEDPENRALADDVLRDFETKVLPHAADLRVGVLHNDANDQNVVVVRKNPRVGEEDVGEGVFTPAGLLDFGDIVSSWRVNDVAISLAYFMLHKEDPVGDAAEMLAGFESRFPLTDLERSLLPILVAARLVCSCVCGAYSAAQDPGNKEYLLLTQRPGWTALRALRGGGEKACLERFAAARG